MMKLRMLLLKEAAKEILVRSPPNVAGFSCIKGAGGGGRGRGGGAWPTDEVLRHASVPDMRQISS